MGRTAAKMHTKKYARELAGYLESCGGDGATIGLSDAALCAKVLRRFSHSSRRRLLSAALVVPSLFSAVIFGDVNGDGRVDEKDLRLLTTAMFMPLSGKEGMTPNPLRLSRPAWEAIDEW